MQRLRWTRLGPQTPFRYRITVGAVLLGVFAALWAVRELVSFEAYQRTIMALGIWVSRMPFSDFHAILAAAECNHYGINVFEVNPCDFAGRVHIYSPLWLLLIPAIIHADAWWIGATLSVLFLLSIAWLCPARNRKELTLFLALCCSSAVLFAAVRANNDIVVFMLVLLACKLFSEQRLRTISYGAIFLATALKFYPLSAFAILTTERFRRALAVGASVAAATLLLVANWRSELAAAARHFPVHYLSDEFSASNLFGTLPAAWPERFAFVEPYVGILTGLVSLMAILAALKLSMSLHKVGRWCVGTEETVLFVAGASMILGCFFAGHSIHYRAIFLLLTVPLLLAWLRDGARPLRMVGRVGTGLVGFGLFQSFLRSHLFGLLNALHGPTYRISMVYWIAEEFVWWSLVIALMSTVFLIAWDSRTGLEVRRYLRLLQFRYGSVVRQSSSLR